MNADERRYGSNINSRGGTGTLESPIHKISLFRSSAFIRVHPRLFPYRSVSLSNKLFVLALSAYGAVQIAFLRASVSLWFTHV